MKLIIDISEDVYTRLFDNGIQDNEIAVDDVCEIARALRVGTPLDDVKAEIKAMFPPSGNWMYDEEYEHEHTVCEVLVDVLKILDNIGKGDSE